MIQLRPYQEALVHHTTPAIWREGSMRIVWVLPTGGGKTRCALALIERARAKDWAAVYYFAHTGELVTQPGDQMHGLTEFAYLRAGVRGDAAAGVQVCSAQTAVGRNLPPIPRADGTPHRRCIAIVDECFPATTTVDGVPIKSIQVGDLVWSADLNGIISKKKVTHKFRKKISGRLIEIYTDTGLVIRSTAEHPFFLGSSFVAAKDIKSGDTLYGNLSVQERVYGVRRGIHGSKSGLDVLAKMPWSEGAEEEVGETDRHHVHGLRVGDRTGGARREGAVQPNWSGVLLEEVLPNCRRKSLESHAGEHESSSGVREDGQEQPNAPRGSAGKGESKTQRYRSPATHPRGEWEGANNTSKVAICRPECSRQGVGDGVCGTHWVEAALLQDRHSPPSPDDCSGDRRRRTQRVEGARSRQEEGRVSPIARVVRTAVLEPRSAKLWLEENCGDDSVYNLEVEDNHTYFADNILVHNCHRFRSTTYHTIHQRLSESYEHVYLILMTATPYRRDGRGLGEVADALVEAVTPRELVAAGVLVDPVVYSRPAPGLAASATLGGEWFEAGTAASAVSAPGIVGDCVREWERRAEGAPTVYRCVNRAHARDVAARFRAAGHRAGHIDGTMPQAGRELLLARLAIGGSASAHPLALDVLTCGGPLMEEGFDSASSYRHVLSRPEMWPTRAIGALPAPGAPAVSGVGHRSVDDEPPPYAPLACLGDAAPTTSRGAWIQRVGRVARAFTGADVAALAARGVRSSPKRGAVVLCHSGNLERHGFLLQHEEFRLAGDREGAATAYPRYHPPPLRQCAACFACVPPGAAECPACAAPAPTPPLPEERPTVELRRADPSAPPPDTDDQRAEFLRAQWGRWSSARDAGRTYSVWWPAARYRARYGSWPNFGLNAAIARSHGARLTPPRKGAKIGP